MNDLDDTPKPEGELTLQQLTMPADTNPHGDIYGGWLMSKMDLAGAITAQKFAKGRVTTVASGEMVFLRPVEVGSTISLYTRIIETGRSSMRVFIDVWMTSCEGNSAKITEGDFVYVAIDDNGNTRSLKN